VSYINEFDLPDIGIEEIVPWTFIFDEIPVQSGNTVDEAKRFLISDSSDTGTDISANASVVAGTNQMLLTNIWLDADTPAVGKYRIQVRMKDNTGTVQEQEGNFIVTVKV
jgi:hypothetical protein